MILYPAIDIRAGKCVRLYQGNYAFETIYNESPMAAAAQFVTAGASWVHIVDLDGAKNPKLSQAALIKELLKTIPITIQVGGGIRTEAQIDSYLAAGASRVVIGSLAINSPETVAAWLSRYGAEQLVLAFDIDMIKGRPYVMTEAWQKVSNVALFDVVKRFSALGVKHILCTDINKDGALCGPNIALYEQLIERFPSLTIQASGGIRSLDDIGNLKKLNIAGAIIGRALYEKKIDFTEALLC